MFAYIHIVDQTFSPKLREDTKEKENFASKGILYSYIKLIAGRIKIDQRN